MDELRWILVGFGVVLLAGIYLWGRRGEGANGREAQARARPEPSLEPVEHVMGDEPTGAPGRSLDTEPADEPITAQRRSAHEIASSGDRDEPHHDRSADASASPVRAGARHEPMLDHAASRTDAGAEEGPAAPTLSSSESPPPRRPERRKILSLRLAAAPHKYEGQKLLEALQAESLELGKYDIFHRLHERGAAIFSVAGMVEPGSFDLTTMPEQRYAGVTLFAQLPGPTPGMYALNEMIASARKLQLALGGTLQDDRGAPLTVHRIERMRQEVREFERPISGAHRSDSSFTAH